MAIPLPKLALLNQVATDGRQLYNASAFAAGDNCTNEIYMVLTAPGGEVMVVWLSAEDLRKLVELTAEV